MKYIQSRLSKLQSLLREQKIESLLVTTPANLSYLTGVFPVNSHEREAYFLITQEEACLLISPLKSQQFANLNHIQVQVMSREFSLNDLFKIYKVKNIAVEARNLSYSESNYIEKDLGINIKSSENFLENLRLIKDKVEIESIKNACSITAKTWREIQPHIKPGAVELELAQTIISIQISLGAEGVPAGFNPIVAAGPNSAIPHHSSSHKIISKNDVIIFDFGCTVNGYASDFTRTIKLGDQTDEFVSIQNAVMDSYQKAAIAISSHSPKQIDKATVDHFKSLGLEKYILHTTGHGLGLDIHEQPSISIYAKKEFTLKQGMVITIEPGLYLSGKFGYRHENTILVTNTGFETLTQI